MFSRSLVETSATSTELYRCSSSTEEEQSSSSLPLDEFTKNAYLLKELLSSGNDQSNQQILMIYAKGDYPQRRLLLEAIQNIASSYQEFPEIKKRYFLQLIQTLASYPDLDPFSFELKRILLHQSPPLEKMREKAFIKDSVDEIIKSSPSALEHVAYLKTMAGRGPNERRRWLEDVIGDEMKNPAIHINMAQVKQLLEIVNLCVRNRQTLPMSEESSWKES